MRHSTFQLNGQAISLLNLGGISFPAFSGLGDHVNKRMSACILNEGPIPPGEYFIVDRQSGGRLGKLKDAFSGRGDWFALYANDGSIDDEVWCEQVLRGNFRLHPKGPRGISQGCIVINQPTDFHRLRLILRSNNAIEIPETNIKAWAKVLVR